eukprot:TRINITY_DN9081_c0_g1_i1.p1 TRINITY_DN9081_c0_g1~~TRINITY_DN9081_c0_g1_i1.p1  ORF type:complete len:537 (+),score=83.24 TRINITY_DN9081_c0_g1_i1:101-1711(+)
MLQSGAVLHGRWKVLQKIGQGAFGEAYSGYDMIGDCQVAIKLEKISPQKQVLRQEVNIIKRLQECPHVCRFYYCGRTPDFNYLVMELLGENLSEIRKRQPEARFSLNTTARLGIQMISALEQIHALGYLHRDFKPSNLAMGLGREKDRCYILDFGLSRRYLSSDGSIRPARDSVGFRGTARYASINSHDCKELSRRDDLWSFFYVMVEFVKGQLPWRRIRDKEQIGIMKRACDTTDLVRGMPPEFLVLYHYLHSLKYEDVPDYDLLRRLLVDVNQRENLSLHHPYDWELSSQNTCSPADHYSIKSPEPLSEEEGSKLSLNHDAADNEAEVIDRPSREQRVGRGDENDGANLSQQHSTMNASGSVPNQTTRRISMRSTENTWGQQTEHRVSFRGEQYREEFEESPTLDSKLRPRPPENSPPQGLSSLMKLKRIIQRTGSLAGFADVGSLSLPRNGGDAPAASPLDLNSLSARALFTGFASLSQRHSISHTDTSRQHDVAASKATPTQQTDEKQTHRPRAVSQPNDKGTKGFIGEQII